MIGVGSKEQYKAYWSGLQKVKGVPDLYNVIVKKSLEKVGDGKAIQLLNAKTLPTLFHS